MLTINNYNTREQTFRGCALFHKNSAKQIIDESYKKIDKDSPEFIRECYRFFRSTFNRPTEINVESERLMDIVNSQEGSIFIMNHTSKSIFDVFAAKFFNALLYREYLYKDVADKCPRSKVLANSKILAHKADGGEKYRWMGVLPLKVGLGDKNAKTENSKLMDKVAQEISENKTNLFVFPEGALLSLSFLPLKYKFQPGISAIVKRVLELKESVNVIPLGFAHNFKESSIYIGKPVKFSKEDGEYYASSGNINSLFADDKLVKFFSYHKSKKITENGNPIGKDKIVPYISGILSANLNCCKKEAEAALEHNDNKVYEI